MPLLRNESNEVLLVDVGRRAVHTVNMTGGMIWAQCDGHQSVAEITATLAEMFSTTPDVIAADVHKSITDFRNFGLLRTKDDPPFPSMATTELRPGPDGSSYVIPSPCNCGLDLETLAWAGTLTVAVGRIRLGVRYDVESTGAVVREALREWVIDDDAAPVTYSIVMPGDQPPLDDRLRAGVYEGRRLQPGPGDPDGIVRLLQHRIETWRPLSPSEIRLTAIGVASERSAALVPGHYGLDGQLEAVAGAPSDRQFLASPVVVDTDQLTVGGRPLAGIIWPAAATERLEGDDVLRQLVPLVDVRDGDDLEAVVDALDAVAGHVNAVLTPPEQVADVAAALIRPR